jgi:hypothetical protein
VPGWSFSRPFEAFFQDNYRIPDLFKFFDFYNIPAHFQTVGHKIGQIAKNQKKLWAYCPKVSSYQVALK